MNVNLQILLLSEMSWDRFDAARAGDANAPVIQFAIQCCGLGGWRDARQFLAAELQRFGGQVAVAILGARP
ncbi:hypothetical protein xavtCFBP7764_22380 [Xanthomonas citri]|nr:hypothetical protein xavtCFBP7764_22380 [Xanthomonas citri]